MSINIERYVKEGAVHGKVYTDPEIFKLEMEKIFHKTWIFVAHESEVASPGDYKTLYIGLQPVIVSRGADDNQIYVMYNRCRHRGATVCQSEYGNSNYFRCAYHGWTYKNSGELNGVPMKNGYGADFDACKLSLVHVSRVANYRGFIFASLSEDVPELEEFLGHACQYLDKVAEQGPNGFELSAGVQKYKFEGNWKLQIENTIDPYHFSFVHRSHEILAERDGKGLIKMADRAKLEKTLALGDGHAYYQSGGDVGLGGIGFNLVIFPNLAFVGSHLRYVRPISESMTEVYVYPMMLKDVESEVNRARLRGHETFFGPASFGTPDDIEVGFIRVQKGLVAEGNEWLLLERGLGQETEDEQGIVVGSAPSDEASNRAFYRKWKSMMSKE